MTRVILALIVIKWEVRQNNHIKSVPFLLVKSGRSNNVNIVSFISNE